MTRLSGEKKREQQQAAVPVDVRVPADGPGEPGASVDGVRVIAGPGEEIQQAVLDRLHRLAVASGHAVIATVRDERIGYVVPLLVAPDGSSRFTDRPTLLHAAQGDHRAGAAEPTPGEPAPDMAAAHPQAPAAPGPVRDVTPTFPLRPVPGTEEPLDSPPTFRLRTVTGPVHPGTPPGTVAPPTGAFGPPPSMEPAPQPAKDAPTPVRGRSAPTDLMFDADPDARPTPPRGFDAVAEAVLGDEPAAPAGSPLAAPLERINEAVRAGRIDTAAGLADETVAQASRTLGAEHPEVLRLRELTAYIAYLAGEPLRAFRLSMDLAVACRRAGDAEAAYGNVRSAATAWRGVRDPLLGLELGHELTALWTELAAEGGPAADEADELESAHARMDRLTARARKD
ncbi:tetratricopeptide repeat protein [Streptomyces sp. RO-S4]|uniref:tetratricopeptide repeat protein n=1 Tax=Streptomyces sp. RO-S4 TaxID=2902486 RepID=UPI00208F9AA6|nr:tetratricopeptide repeat protein [Streptomyces sp. RO-S4]MCO4700152.1 tetratricopeptide repeat protein [Streptomyces sp. RO-S4]